MAKRQPRAGDALDRRDFLKRGTVVPVAAMLGGLEIGPAPRPAPRRSRSRAAEPVACGIIGFGEWGRELATTLGRLESARIAAVSDRFPLMLQRAERAIPEAARHEDYRALLDDPAVTAVLIATPTHSHREIAIAALGAGKHVYCEVPLAHTVADARAIAEAARSADGQVFQCGLQHRCEPQHRGVFQFIRSGAIGRGVAARAQWHRKQSWRRASATAGRERELNWRLDPALSTGIAGEIAIHQIDLACWMLQARPVSVRGTGQIMHWRDGREVADTIQALVEFPDRLQLTYDATLANSFDGEYAVFQGSDGTVMLRDNKGWMFKEVDAPLLGWEVYARKDRFYREVGVALVADATKLAAQGIDPTQDDPNAETALFHALEEFLDNSVNGPFPPSAGYRQGYDATVIALATNAAVTSSTAVAIEAAPFPDLP
ncbi:MAG TPA: Gfo/Idh/MocA family oxidoreductase [Longimicrobiales bacterium]|nr:Gfo/Idh/MocA family oxidoreductase [Longimicrobiales bacterium]